MDSMHIGTQVWLNTFAAAVKQSAGFAEIRTRAHQTYKHPEQTLQGAKGKKKKVEGCWYGYFKVK